MVKIEKELEVNEDSVKRMAESVVQMHEKVVCVLKKPSREIALDIVQGDDFINHLEEEINDQSVRSLALLSPVASDLRKVVADIKIASELERIADYAKNIAAFLIKSEVLEENVMAYAAAMEKRFIEMLKETLKAYEQRDVKAAFQLPKKDEGINQLYEELKQNLLRHPNETLVVELFEISAMLRNIERAGDHTKNICEHIIYMVKGQHYDFG